MVIWKMSNNFFLQILFLQNDRQDFLKDVEVKFTYKQQASDPTKQEFYWMEVLRTLYLDDLNIEREYY